VSLNPNHVRANQLLADLLLAQGELAEARELLERLYEYQPAAARSRLVQALLAQADIFKDEDELLALYERVLQIDPSQRKATVGVEEIRRARRRRDMKYGLQKLTELEQEGRYEVALDMARTLADQYPHEREWEADLERLERKTHLADLYQRGLSALEAGDRERAQTLLAQVVALEPGYEEATRYLHQAVTGVDVGNVQRRPNWLAGLPGGALLSLSLVILVVVGIVWIAYRSLGTGGTSASPTSMPTSTATSTPTPSATSMSASTSTSVPTETPVSIPSPTSTSISTSPSTPIPTLALSIGDVLTRTQDGARMVGVPAGTFEMGSPEGDEDEQPVHDVTLDGFWLDQTEMTNAQFAAFLNEEGNQEEGDVTWLDVEDEDCLIEQSGGEFQPKRGYADHPVIEVSWYGARAYCEWAGGRLPTEAEWEYAARGSEGHIYPWGDEDPTCDLAQYVSCSGRTVPVGSFPDGASWCDALDMSGNVWEWVADWYGDYSSEAQANPTGPETGENRVLRGGSWDYSPNFLRGAHRGWAPPDYRFNYGGFRCARGSQ
jgi:formylglycine-generating enzyme required for sulfatase activity